MAYSEQFNNLLRDIAYDSSDLSSAYSDGYTPQRRIESIYDYWNKQQDYANKSKEDQKNQKQLEDMTVEERADYLQRQREEGYSKPMEGLDWLFGHMSQAGQSISDPLGWQKYADAHIQEEGWTPENIGRWLGATIGNALPQTLGGLLMAPAELYEAIPGTNAVTESSGDKMADYGENGMDWRQKVASGVEGVADILPFIPGVGGSVGRLIPGVAKGLKVANAAGDATKVAKALGANKELGGMLSKNLTKQAAKEGKQIAKNMAEIGIDSKSQVGRQILEAAEKNIGLNKVAESGSATKAFRAGKAAGFDWYDNQSFGKRLAMDIGSNIIEEGVAGGAGAARGDVETGFVSDPGEILKGAGQGALQGAVAGAAMELGRGAKRRAISKATGGKASTISGAILNEDSAIRKNIDKLRGTNQQYKDKNIPDFSAGSPEDIAAAQARANHEIYAVNEISADEFKKRQQKKNTVASAKAATGKDLAPHQFREDIYDVVARIMHDGVLVEDENGNTSINTDNYWLNYYANMANISVEEYADLIMSKDLNKIYRTTNDRYQQRRQDTGLSEHLMLGEDPATNEGAFLMEYNGFTIGSPNRIQLHPWFSSRSNQDFDGDNVKVWLPKNLNRESNNPQEQYANTVYDRLLRNGGKFGNSSLTKDGFFDSWFADKKSKVGDKQASEKFDIVYNQNKEIFDRINPYQKENARNKWIKKQKKLFSHAWTYQVNDSGDSLIDTETELAQWLSNIRTKLYESYLQEANDIGLDQGIDTSTDSGKRRFDNLKISYALQKTNNALGTLLTSFWSEGAKDARASQAIEQVSTIRNRILEDSNGVIDITGSNAEEWIQTSQAVRPSVRASRMMEQILSVASERMASEKNNTVFRADQALYLILGKGQTTQDERTRITENMRDWNIDEFRYFANILFGLNAIDEKIAAQFDNMYKSFVFEHALDEAGLRSVDEINNMTQVGTLLSKIVQLNDEYAEIYNNAWALATLDGRVETPGFVERKFQKTTKIEGVNWLDAISNILLSPDNQIKINALWNMDAMSLREWTNYLRKNPTEQRYLNQSQDLEDANIYIKFKEDSDETQSIKFGDLINALKEHEQVKEKRQLGLLVNFVTEMVSGFIDAYKPHGAIEINPDNLTLESSIALHDNNKLISTFYKLWNNKWWKPVQVDQFWNQYSKIKRLLDANDKQGAVEAIFEAGYVSMMNNVYAPVKRSLNKINDVIKGKTELTEQEKADIETEIQKMFNHFRSIDLADGTVCENEFHKMMKERFLAWLEPLRSTDTKSDSRTIIDFDKVGNKVFMDTFESFRDLMIEDFTIDNSKPPRYRERINGLLASAQNMTEADREALLNKLQFDWMREPGETIDIFGTANRVTNAKQYYYNDNWSIKDLDFNKQYGKDLGLYLMSLGVEDSKNASIFLQQLCRATQLRTNKNINLQVSRSTAFYDPHTKAKGTSPSAIAEYYAYEARLKKENIVYLTLQWKYLGGMFQEVTAKNFIMDVEAMRDMLFFHPNNEVDILMSDGHIETKITRNKFIRNLMEWDEDYLDDKSDLTPKQWNEVLNSQPWIVDLLLPQTVSIGRLENPDSNSFRVDRATSFEQIKNDIITQERRSFGREEDRTLEEEFLLEDIFDEISNIPATHSSIFFQLAHNQDLSLLDSDKQFSEMYEKDRRMLLWLAVNAIRGENDFNAAFERLKQQGANTAFGQIRSTLYGPNSFTNNSSNTENTLMANAENLSKVQIKTTLNAYTSDIIKIHNEDGLVSDENSKELHSLIEDEFNWDMSQDEYSNVVEVQKLVSDLRKYYEQHYLLSMASELLQKQAKQFNPPDQELKSFRNIIALSDNNIETKLNKIREKIDQKKLSDEEKDAMKKLLERTMDNPLPVEKGATEQAIMKEVVKGYLTNNNLIDTIKEYLLLNFDSDKVVKNNITTEENNAITNMIRDILLFGDTKYSDNPVIEGIIGYGRDVDIILTNNNNEILDMIKSYVFDKDSSVSIDDIRDAINLGILNQDLSQYSKEIGSDTIQLNGFQKAEDFLFKPIYKKINEWLNNLPEDEKQNIINIANRINFAEEEIDSAIDGLNFTSDANIIDTMRTVNILGTNATAKMAGYNGNIPKTAYTMLCFSEMKNIDPVRTYDIGFDSEGNPLGLENEARQLLNIAMMKTTNKTAIEEYVNEDDPFWNELVLDGIENDDQYRAILEDLIDERFINENRRWVATPYLKKILGINKQDNTPIKITKDNLITVLMYIRDNQSGPENEIQLCKWYGYLYDDCASLFEHVMEARILKIKKFFNDIIRYGSVEPTRWSEPMLKPKTYKGSDMGITSDPKETCNNLLQNFDQMCDSYSREHIREAFKDPKDYADLKFTTPMVIGNIPNNRYANNTVFGDLFIRFQMRDNQGNVYIVTENQINEAKVNGVDYIDLHDGTKLNFADIESYTIYLIDWDSLEEAQTNKMAQAQSDAEKNNQKLSESRIRQIGLNEWLYPTQPTSNNHTGHNMADMMAAYQLKTTGKNNTAYYNVFQYDPETQLRLVQEDFSKADNDLRQSSLQNKIQEIQRQRSHYKYTGSTWQEKMINGQGEKEWALSHDKLLSFLKQIKPSSDGVIPADERITQIYISPKTSDYNQLKDKSFINNFPVKTTSDTTNQIQNGKMLILGAPPKASDWIEIISSSLEKNASLVLVQDAKADLDNFLDNNAIGLGQTRFYSKSIARLGTTEGIPYTCTEIKPARDFQVHNIQYFGKGRSAHHLYNNPDKSQHKFITTYSGNESAASKKVGADGSILQTSIERKNTKTNPIITKKYNIKEGEAIEIVQNQEELNEILNHIKNNNFDDIQIPQEESDILEKSTLQKNDYWKKITQFLETGLDHTETFGSGIYTYNKPGFTNVLGLIKYRVGNDIKYRPIFYMGNETSNPTINMYLQNGTVYIMSYYDTNMEGSSIEDPVLGSINTTEEENMQIKQHNGYLSYKGEIVGVDEDIILPNGCHVAYEYSDYSIGDKIDEGTFLLDTQNVIAPAMAIYAGAANNVAGWDISIIKRLLDVYDYYRSDQTRTNEHRAYINWIDTYFNPDNNDFYTVTRDEDGNIIEYNVNKSIGNITNRQWSAMSRFVNQDLAQDAICPELNHMDKNVNVKEMQSILDQCMRLCVGGHKNFLQLWQTGCISVPDNLSELKDFIPTSRHMSYMFHWLTHRDGEREIIAAENYPNDAIPEKDRPIISGITIAQDIQRDGKSISTRRANLYVASPINSDDSSLEMVPTGTGNYDFNQTVKQEFNRGIRAHMNDLVAERILSRNNLQTSDKYTIVDPIIRRNKEWSYHGYNIDTNDSIFDMNAKFTSGQFVYNNAYSSIQDFINHIILAKNRGEDFVTDENGNSLSIFGDNKIRTFIKDCINEANQTSQDINFNNQVILGFHDLVCAEIFRTYSPQENGLPVLTINTYMDAAKRVVDKIKEADTIGWNGKDNAQYRYGGQLRWQGILTDSNAIKLLCNLNNNYDEEIIINEAITNIDRLAKQIMLNEHDKKKRSALINYLLYQGMELGLPLDDRCFLGRISIYDWFDNSTRFRDVFMPGFGDPEIFIEAQKKQAQMLSDYQHVMEQSNVTIVKNNGAEFGTYAIKENQKVKSISNVLRNVVTINQINGLLSSGVFLQGFVDRPCNYIGQKMLFDLGSHGRGPLKTWADVLDVVSQSVEDIDELIDQIATPEFCDALIECQVTGWGSGSQELLIQILQSGGTIEDYKNALKTQGKTSSALDTVFGPIAKIMTASFMYKKSMAKNFLRHWLKEVIENGHGEYLFSPQIVSDPETGETHTTCNFERLVGSDKGTGALAVSMVFGDKTMPVDISGQVALNMTMAADMIGKNGFSTLLEAAASEHEIFDFVLRTTACRYVRAMTNVTNRYLNWSLPMKTTNYVFCKIMGNEKTFEFLANKKLTRYLFGLTPDDKAAANVWKNNFEIAKQCHSLRQALITDAMHMTIPAIAWSLAMGSFITVPDDDDYLEDYEEYLIFGIPIKNAWWAKDILGLAIPLACFWKASFEGRGNINVYLHALADQLGNNPILKWGDCIKAVLEPDLVLEDAEKAANKYKDYPEGDPNAIQYFLTSVPMMGLSWITNWITPSIMKEYIQVWPTEERSYNKIFEQKNGQLTEDGRNGKTEKTTFYDAQWRKLSRTNPIVGFLMNGFSAITGSGNGTGYLPGQMPYTEYYDDAQLNFMKNYTVNGKSGKDREIVIAQLLYALNNVKDLSQLKEMGWHLDEETRNAVAEYIHDLLNAIQEDWQAKEAAGLLSYDILGDGDYNLGKKRYAQAKKAYQDQIAFYKDLYSNKLMNKELNQPMQTYHRIAQSYTRDKSGNVYGSGYQKGLGGLLSPITTIFNNSLTSGSDNGFATLSEVTGSPMYNEQGNPMRGLIAQETTETTPKIEDWGKTYNNNYSSSYGTTYSSNYSKGSLGYASGSGGSRSIYSHAPSLSLSAAATPRTSNRREAQYEYLRPEYATSGSRLSRKYNS